MKIRGYNNSIHTSYLKHNCVSVYHSNIYSFCGRVRLTHTLVESHVVLCGLNFVLLGGGPGRAGAPGVAPTRTPTTSIPPFSLFLAVKRGVGSCGCGTLTRTTTHRHMLFVGRSYYISRKISPLATFLDVSQKPRKHTRTTKNNSVFFLLCHIRGSCFSVGMHVLHTTSAYVDVIVMSVESANNNLGVDFHSVPVNAHCYYL